MSVWGSDETDFIALDARFAAAAGAGAAAVTAAIATLSAFFVRGGVGLLLAGLLLRARNGERASRSLCALRSLLAWTPLATVALTLFAAVHVPEVASTRWVTWICVGALVLYVLQALSALVEPRTSLLDRLTRTHVALR